MKEKLVLSVLVDNESGVLQRVASLFSRRSYNISSLTVSETEDEKFSRMTIETETEPENVRQIKAQLLKLEIVKKVSSLSLTVPFHLNFYLLRCTLRVLSIRTHFLHLMLVGALVCLMYQ